MRGALVTLLAMALLVAIASAQQPDRSGRALATVYTSFGDPRGEVFNDRAGTTEDETLTDYTDPEVRIAAGEAVATVDDDGSARAIVSADGIGALGDRVTVDRVERTAIVRPNGSVSFRGRVTGLRIDGEPYPTGRVGESFKVRGLEVVVNEGTTGLRIISGPGDLRFAVARASQRVEAQPDPTPTPTPEPTPTPKPTATAETEDAKPSRAERAAQRLARVERRAQQRMSTPGWRFPVLGAPRTADTFGAARAAPIVEHEGVDIFAEFGTPVVAVRDGRLFNVGTLDISGNRLWLETDDGDAFFYAHLSAFAPAAKEDARVKAGTVLGYTGNTGDAEPTPPHVHFEIHPRGDQEPAIDPYPIVMGWPGAGRSDDGGDRAGSLVTVRDFLAE